MSGRSSLIGRPLRAGQVRDGVPVAGVEYIDGAEIEAEAEVVARHETLRHAPLSKQRPATRLSFHGGI